jgi:hypothetical protein
MKPLYGFDEPLDFFDEGGGGVLETFDQTTGLFVDVDGHKGFFLLLIATGGSRAGFARVRMRMGGIRMVPSI